ncbi:MAG: hypothetical protein PHF51_05020 [Candidatus ainarchaeum sp.]|nr:hypothetical protein [Candidatus ainarchaeum sp.]
MEKRIEEKIRAPGPKGLALLLLAVSLAFLCMQLSKMGEIGSFLWLERPSSDEIYLLDYPKIVESSGMATFWAYSSAARECELCGRTVELAKGENRLQSSPAACENSTMRLACGGRSLSFTFVESAALPCEMVSATVSERLENRTLLLSISGNGIANGFHPLEISVNGEKAASPLHMLEGSFNFTEHVPAPDGVNHYEVRYGGELLGAGSFSQEPAFSPFALASILLCAALAFTWANAGSADRLLIFIVLLSLALVAEFRLDYYGLGFIVPAALLPFAFAGVSRCMKQAGQKHDSPEKGEKGLLAQAIAFGLLFAALIALINLAIYSFDIWGAYYFRHAGEAFARGTTSYFDSLSYLGRPFTYPPVFFEFCAEFSRAFAFVFPAYESFRVPLGLLVAFAYGATSLIAFRRLPFNSRILAAAILVTLWGTVMTAAGIGIQLLAFTLVNCAVALMASRPLFSAIGLGLGFAAHPLALALYPFMALSANAFSASRRLVVWGAIIAFAAVLVSLPFYLPIFLRAGLPYEIVPQKWGYLLSYGIDGIRFGMGFLLPLALAGIAYALHSRKFILPAALLSSIILFSAFVSQRADIIFAAAAAGFVPLAFRRQLEDRRFLALLLLAFILPAIALGAIVMNGTTYYCSWGLSNDVCVSPMKYVSSYSPSSARVALNPLYGHVETYVGKRAVLADLYVEYADEEKFLAENNFYEQGNASGLEKFNVTFALLDDFTKPRVVPGADRVYDNGYMHAFRLG